MSGQGLWADEFFSLAIATGHSVEHLQDFAEPSAGDYVEPRAPVSRQGLARYLEHERPPAGWARVSRATLLSDTSPPLYYLLLNLWTRLLGTSDGALRGFSLLASLATMTLLAALARRLGGRRAIVPSLALFALAPAAVHYGSEGRMYALLGLIAAAQALASLRVRRRSAVPVGPWLVWSGLASAGLLTHYFYAFPLAMMALWLLLDRRRVPTRHLAAASALSLAAVARWYLEIPAAVSQWRVTAGWLDGAPELTELSWAPFRLAASFLSGTGPWGGSNAIEPYLMVLVGSLGLALVPFGRRRAVALCGLWLAGACLAPIVFDLLQNTQTTRYSRYVLAGLPAAVLLAGSVLARLPRWLSIVIVAATVGLWLPALETIVSSKTRSGEPFLETAMELDRRAGELDLIILHSAPASAAGLARYLKAPTPILPQTQLPFDRSLRHYPVFHEIEPAISGRNRIALVKIHGGNDWNVLAEWLRQRSKQCDLWLADRAGAEILFCQFGR